MSTTLRKAFAFVVALVMALAMIPASFAHAEGETGSITIEDAVVGQTYTVYQILDLESYNESANAYSYKATTAWNTFINSEAIKDTYVVVDAQGYVTWKDSADAAAFAKLAQKYAKDNSIANEGSVTATTTTVSFTDLDLGYYLVDTTLGTLCSLDTTNPSATMQEKNEVPTIAKEVKTQGIKVGDTVDFEIKVTTNKGAQDLTVHDTMTNLNLVENSIAVKVDETSLTNGTDYSISINPSDGCTFEIVFTEAYLNKITSSTEILITYKATLDKSAISNGATNEAKLDYGDSSSATITTTTNVYSVDIVKTNVSDKIITGAEFSLYDSETGGNLIKLSKDQSGYYYPDPNGTIQTFLAGQVTIKGLAANTTYWLEEVTAPNGYNKLVGRTEITINSSDLVAATSADGTIYTSGGIEVENKSGSLLPSTGGMGTTIFYIVGGILVAGAVVLLVAKKRMAANR